MYKPVANHEFQPSPSSTRNNSHEGGTIVRLPLDMRQHKTTLAIAATMIVSCGGILPVILYYSLKYGAKTSDSIAITVATVVFGAYSIIPMITRSYKLIKKDSTVRPIGARARHLDYFQINFMCLFPATTALIAAGCTLASSPDTSKHTTALRIVSMGLPVLMTCVCGQLALTFIAMSLKPSLTYPFRFSSMAKGEKARPGVFTIIEDVVAVDGKQGTEYRRLLKERYQYSEEIRALLRWADAVWGFGGVTVAVVLIIVSWTVGNANVGFVLGWIVPWVWAGLWTALTIIRTKQACRKENERIAGLKF